MKKLLKNLRRQLRIWWYVPRYCRSCEICGICRDEHNQWRCRNGCRFIEYDKASD